MKIFCSQCKIETNHEELRKVEEHYRNDEEGLYANGLYQIVRCKGCEEISFREVWINSEDRDPETGECEEHIKIFPFRGGNVLTIKNYYNAPANLRSIYRETIDAFNNGLYVLTAAGLRAIIEGICNEKKIKSGPIEYTSKVGATAIKRTTDLMGKISGLQESNLLTKAHAEILHEHRFLGNRALHSLDKPTVKELILAIEIIEHTLDNLFEIYNKAAELKLKRQLREKKK